jgi:2-oxoglutarate dehydrogenase E1 component
VLQLINAYRFLGNRWAQLDPLKRSERPSIPELEPSHYGFTEADLGQVFQTGSFAFRVGTATLREILEACGRPSAAASAPSSCTSPTSARSAGYRRKLEPIRSTPAYTAEDKKRFLVQLTQAETLERYLHTKYVGQKRFSLEGGEALILAMDQLIRTAGMRRACRKS